MKREGKFKEFFVVSEEDNSVVFRREQIEEIDCHDTCVHYNQFVIYGIPQNITDGQRNSIYEGKTEHLTRISDVSGTLILCKEMIRRGEDPWLVCDDLDGNLGYAMTVLTTSGGPLNEESGDSYQDVYYLDEITMRSEYKEDYTLRERILKELPNLIFQLLHVNPEIIVHYPFPLEIEKEKDERLDKLERLNNQRIRGAFMKTFPSDYEEEEINHVIPYGEKYQFSKEEFDLLYPDDTAPPYPEEEKNRNEYELFESNGYVEIGESRLLYFEVY